MKTHHYLSIKRRLYPYAGIILMLAAGISYAPVASAAQTEPQGEYITSGDSIVLAPNADTSRDGIASPADSLQKPARPTVGLVLSGGGAKGIAHAGVIKALEENDIPIDYVAGTSMGAIVGSLYSCGWTPARMMEMFTSKEFGYWSTGTIDPKYESYYSKPDPSPEWAQVNLALRDSTDSSLQSLASQILPANLISPIPMNMEFLKLYLPYTAQCGENFNNLFVPFRCVTSDVYHKHKIVCSDGSLGDAVRASMSFPFVFKPIKMDGVLVYDGGIYDNFPVDVMQHDFNPDFIIGVSVSSPDTPPQQNDIYSQLEDMIIQNNNYSVPPEVGVKIQVPVLDFGVLEFDKAQEIYDIGYKTGLAMVDSIKSRVSSRVPEVAVNARRQAFAEATPDIKFDKIQVTGATKMQSRFLARQFNPDHLPVIDMDQVERGYYRAVTGGKLADLLPTAKLDGGDDDNTLMLQATVKNRWKFGVGGWVTSSTNSQLYLSFGYRTLSFNSLSLGLGGWIGQSYYAARLHGSMTVNSDTPSDVAAEFVVSRQKYYGSELLFYENSTPSFIADMQIFGRVSYNRQLGMKAKGYVSAGWGYLSDSYYPTNTGDFSRISKDKTRYSVGELKVGVESSTLNDPMYPNEGRELRSNIIGSYEFTKYLPEGDKAREVKYGGHGALSLEVYWRNFFRLHKKFTVGVTATAIATLQKLYQDYTATLVHSAAFAPTPSTRNYFNVAFRSNNYVAAGITPVWNPVGKLQLRGDFHAFAPFRNIVQTSDGMARYSGSFRKIEFIGEIAGVYNFPFASLAIYVNYLSYPSRNWNFGINLGLLFQAPRFLR